MHVLPKSVLRFAALGPIYLLLSLLSPLEAEAQEIEVLLTERTTKDIQSVHILPLTREPEERIEKLPQVDMSHARSLTVFYSRAGQGSDKVSVLVIPSEEGDLLYIDLNNDEDLTNDGPPRLFAKDENEHRFYIRAEPDTLIRVGRILSRVPSWGLPGEKDHAYFQKNYMDEEGNLRPETVEQWRENSAPELDGRRGTYFFDGRLNLSRGKLLLEDTAYEIGLYDPYDNGRFDDVNNEEEPRFSDLLLIDLNRNGELNTYFDVEEVFRLDDVFSIGGKRYKLSYIDPYGRSLRIVETEETETDYYVQQRRQAEQEALASVGGRGRLGESFWDLELATIEGETIALRDHRGNYILLNFWGEWCAPCISEIPALVRAYDQFRDKGLVMVSILNTFDLEFAKHVMADEGITWPQVLLVEDMEKRFKVQSYPTNLLILPDGESFLHAGGINEAFFERNIE